LTAERSGIVIGNQDETLARLEALEGA